MKRKVLIIYNKVFSYRLKIFDLLNEKYDLTVTHIDQKYKDKEHQHNFKTMYIPVKQIGPFVFHKINLNKLAKNYDVVIGLADIKWLSLMKLGFNPFRKFKLIYWGIGVRASYQNKFDQKTIWSGVRHYMTDKADALIFYSDYPVSKYAESGVQKEKLFVANNTVNAPFDNNKVIKRTNLLFIGTLYPQKGIDILLEAYKQLKAEGFSMLKPLKIVGGGTEFNNIAEWIKSNDLVNDIEMLGPIYDENKLEDIFRSSYACISPKQAGLSVLSSMAYGTVFITARDAITGGEMLNIKDNETGIFFDGSLQDLKEKIKFVCANTHEIERIGNNAFEHYRKNRTPEKMAQGIINAVEYTLNKN